MADDRKEERDDRGAPDEDSQSTTADKRAKDKNSGGNEDKDDENGDGDGDRKPMNPILKIALIVVAVLLVIMAIIYGVYWWTRGSYYQTTNDAYLQADQVSISPRISGFVEAVLVGDNQNVTEGQMLVRISSRDYVAKAEQARAQMEEAQASVLEADAQIRQQEAQIAQSQAELAQSQAQERQYAASAQFNAGEARRYRPLARSGAETDEKYAQYNSESRQSDAQLRGARAQSAADAAKVEYARRQIGIYQAQRLSGEAKLKEAQAQLAAAEVDVNGAILASPIAGRIGDRTVRVGQYLQAGTRVMSVVPVQQLYLKANYKETQIGLMRVGQPADIKVDALSSLVIHGEVESFSPGTGAQFSLTPTDNATGNFTKITQRVPVRIRVDSGPEARQVLVPGLSVSVTVDTFGAKSELEAYKKETKRTRDEREGEARQENAQDRANHTQGAGRE